MLVLDKKPNVVIDRNQDSSVSKTKVSSKVGNRKSNSKKPKTKPKVNDNKSNHKKLKPDQKRGFRLGSERFKKENRR